MKTRDELLKILALGDYRELSSLKKGLKLISDGHCGLTLAGELCSVGRSALQRGLKALTAGRDPGINGRPKIFSASEKENVVNILLQERQEGITIDYEEGKRLCQKEWINSPERDLNSHMPDFSPKYFRGLLKENNFQMKIPRVLEPVSTS
mmetsp:Transcript_5819/g.8087  ORF Transcript_5819/g.8087 Transcript_5819/m.8087 type:complete len:151 (+) Transcript_5819:21-473(+)